MKAYIMTDMEGISGISRESQVKISSPERITSVPLAEGDFNAAITGVADAGASTIVLCDAHGGGNNIKIENMDSRGEYERPAGSRNVMPALARMKFDVGMLIGAHAMAGTLNAFLDHTQSSAAWHNYWINGKRSGEIAQFAAYMGHFDVPMVMVTGDRAACEEAHELLGDIETVAVKEGLCRQHVRCLAVDRAHDQVREAASRALELKDKIKPYKISLPAEVEIEFNRSDTADAFARIPGVQRKAPRRVCRTVKSALELFAW